ncbi:hypothetical protein [Paraburkholderia flava]|uniref:hypothetical protein n=1 Tax=Paraburkholderia flava TaxID=2547393 RepID=UPI001060FB96|nr:hypothetical protein [Paraburkholderia flava]
MWQDEEEFPKQSANNLLAIQLNGYTWIYWLIDHGHERFETVDPDEVIEYIGSCADGWDYVLDSKRKIVETCKLLRDRGFDLKTTPIREIFDYANLPSAAGALAKLPEARATLENIRNGIAEADGAWNKKGRGRHVLYGRGSVVLLLQRLAHPDDSRLLFDPTDDVYNTVSQIAKGDAGRTRLMPIKAALHLMEQAAYWTLHVAPVLLDLRDRLSKIESKTKNWRDGKISVERHAAVSEANKKLKGILAYPIVLSYRDEGILLKKMWNVLMPAASFVVIGSLTARRCGEVESMLVGAWTGTFETGFWITSDIGKTLQKPDETPCSALVVEAVKNMERNRLFGPNGRVGQIFELPTFSSSAKPRPFATRASLQTFCDFVGASAIGAVNGVPWKIAPHQLRKCFAVLYVWRYDGGDLESLSYHLRHFALRMTIRYCGDRDLFEEIGVQAAVFTEQKIANIALGLVNFAGVYGKKLAKLIRRMIPSIELTTERELGRKITRMVKEQKLHLKATPWGFCGCSNAPSHRRRAACQQKDCASRAIDFDGRPDPTGSDEERCSRCFFFYADSTRVPHWEGACAGNRVEMEEPHVALLRMVRLEKRQKILDSFTSTLKREPT